MLVSHKWLRGLTDFSCSPEELENILTMLGIEVEGISRPAEKYEGFYTGKVLDKKEHPDADKLSVCTVDFGKGKKTIVCGAPNVEAGQTVVVGDIGAVVPSAEFRLEKRAIRGVTSEGMICSQAELLTGDDAGGIWVLPEDAPPAKPLAEYLELDDVIYDVSLTPNRADCLSHIGVAREIAAYYGRVMKRPEINLIETGADVSESIKISIEDSEKCPRYAARVIRNVKIGESPDWLKKRLTALGLRPLNSAVDITNYVLTESGQPLHAFDLDKIAGNEIIVKTAEHGQTFTTLDSKERKLDSEMLMICDAEKPVAVGGVMGGENSEINTSTKNILLESAYFQPQSVRRTAKKLGIPSEASHRFERGVDPENVIWALDRAAQMIADICGGTLEKGRIDVYPNKIKPAILTMRFDRARKIIGTDIMNADMVDMLDRLKFDIIEQDNEKIKVQAPKWRVDMEYEIDLIEEIARLYNYDNIIPDYTSHVDYSADQVPEKLAVPPLREKIRSFLIPRGFSETINQNMTSPALAKIFTDKPVEIANPLGEEISVLRPSPVPAMLKTAEWNMRFGNKDLRLFEIGKTFHNIDDKESGFVPGIVEKTCLMLCMTGRSAPMHWSPEKREADFYDIKGTAEDMFAFFRIPGIKLKANDEESLVFSKNSMKILLKKKTIGFFGSVKTEMLKRFDIEDAVYLLEIDLSELYGTKISPAKYSPVAPYPAVTRDIAFVAGKELPAEKIRNEIEQTGGKYLQDVEIFDVYEGKSIEKDKKSIAFSLKFSSPERTLTDEDVDKAFEKIINTVEKKYDAKLRKF